MSGDFSAGLSEAEQIRIARDIDSVTSALSKVATLRSIDPRGATMGLALGAANTAIHAQATREDFMAVCEAAWAKAAKGHH